MILDIILHFHCVCLDEYCAKMQQRVKIGLLSQDMAFAKFVRRNQALKLVCQLSQVFVRGSSEAAIKKMVIELQLLQKMSDHQKQITRRKLSMRSFIWRPILEYLSTSG